MTILNLPFRPLGGGGHVVDGSALFDGTNGYLYRTPFGAGDSTTTGTLEVVVKRAALGSRNHLVNADGAGVDFQLEFGASADELYSDLVYSAANHRRGSNAEYRDPAWMQIVTRLDTGNADASLRVNHFVNGEEIGYALDETVAQNSAIVLGSAVPHYVGAYQGASYFADLYVARIAYVDGQALDPSAFGEVDANGNWQINDVSGLTFGKSGFLLEGRNVAVGLDANQVPGRTKTTASSQWAGATGNYAFSDGGVSCGTANSALRSGATLSGDFELSWKLAAAGGTGDAMTVGLFPASELATFTSSSGNGAMVSMSDSFFVFHGSGTVRHGATTEATPGFAVGNTYRIARTGSTWKLYENGSLIHTWTATGSAEMHICAATGSSMTLTEFEWADAATLANNWFVSGGVTAVDDAPTDDAASGVGNHATANPLHPDVATLSNGNRAATTSTSQYLNMVSTLAVTGPVYFEFEYSALGTNPTAGIVNSGHGDDYVGGGSYGWGWAIASGDLFHGGSSVSSTPSTLAAGTRGCVAFDPDAGKLWTGQVSGSTITWDNGGDPDAGTGFVTGAIDTADTWFAAVSGRSGATASVHFEEGGWTGVTNRPSAFKSLCTANLAAPDVTDPRKYFSTVVYAGDGTSGRSVTGVGFQPDLVINKNRDSVENHVWSDAVRGADKAIFSNLSNAESTGAEKIQSFDSDGFTVGSDVTNNETGSDFVAWCFKAGGAGASNTAGSIASTSSVAPHGGFSIVKWTGTGAVGTVGHGLSRAPGLVILKRLDTAGYSWSVGGDVLTDWSKELVLDSTAAEATNANAWNGTAPTSSVFTVGPSGNHNASGGSYVAYCFANVPGLFKVGGYTGNGSADGPFVPTPGMRPGLVLVKNTTLAGTHWFLFDAARDADNPSARQLYPNVAYAEDASGSYGTLDFVAGGFKVRGAYNHVNGSGDTMAFLAVAAVAEDGGGRNQVRAR